MKKFLATYIILALSIFSTLAKGPVKLSGLVTDQNNEPLEFVTVKVQGKTLGTTSGLDGRYSLSIPEADTIRVVFSCIGFEESKRRLIDASGDVTLNVKMTPATYALGGIEVTDFQKQTSGMQKIDGSSYKLAPDVSGGSVRSMLSTLAGVNSTNEMSSQYSVRGGSYDENSVYINGIEVYRPQLISSGQQEGLSIVNPDMVGAIGFSTGGFLGTIRRQNEQRARHNVPRTRNLRGFRVSVFDGGYGICRKQLSQVLPTPWHTLQAEFLSP